MNKPITVAICGCGNRGLEAYAPFALKYPDKMKVVAGADIKPERLRMLRERFDVPEEMCFASDLELLAQPRLADVMIVATQDRLHIRPAMAALEKGYHLLLEKPISSSLDECIALREKAHECGRAVVVCHVLRYTKFYSVLEKLLREGAVGKLQTIDAMEHVAYWHFAHSYVRGNWRREDESSPMILAKCCHDMDLFRWLAGQRCLAVQSFGSLDWFRRENAPDGAADRCLDCPVSGRCIYDARRLYLTDPHCGYERVGNDWPVNVVATDPDPDKLLAALRTGPYGRCVYRCDNDVADHQTVHMLFETGITGSFTVSAFTDRCYRTVKITGTAGQIEGNMAENKLLLQPLGGQGRVIDLNAPDEAFSGHGGGDYGLLDSLFALLDAGRADGLTSVEASVESHVMALAAEWSRTHGGQTVDLEEFQRRQA